MEEHVSAALEAKRPHQLQRMRARLAAPLRTTRPPAPYPTTPPTAALRRPITAPKRWQSRAHIKATSPETPPRRRALKTPRTSDGRPSPTRAPPTPTTPFCPPIASIRCATELHGTPTRPSSNAHLAPSTTPTSHRNCPMKLRPPRSLRARCVRLKPRAPAKSPAKPCGAHDLGRSRPPRLPTNRNRSSRSVVLTFALTLKLA